MKLNKKKERKKEMRNSLYYMVMILGSTQTMLLLSETNRVVATWDKPCCSYVTQAMLLLRVTNLAVVAVATDFSHTFLKSI